MSNKIKSPNEKSNGFLWALIALILVAAAVIGFIVMSNRSGHEQQDVSFAISVENDAVVLKSSSAGDDTPAVDLYEDFSCPHCSELAIASDAAVKQAVEDGKLIVNVRTLNFLDNNNKKKYSTSAGTAALAVAKSGDANTYWNFRGKLMAEQRSGYNKWTNGDFAKFAADYGASEDVVNSIKNSSEEEAFLKEAEANYKKLETETGSVSSPRVIKDGKDVQIGDASGVNDSWVAEVSAS